MGGRALKGPRQAEACGTGVSGTQSGGGAAAGAIGDGGEEVFALELRVLVEDFLHGGARGQEVEEQGDPDTCAANARFAAADARVAGDAGQEVHDNELLQSFADFDVALEQVGEEVRHLHSVLFGLGREVLPNGAVNGDGHENARVRRRVVEATLA